MIAGQTLGTYTIIAKLGAGGMGEVYRARDSRLGRDVALKILPPEVTSDPGRLERFDREARAIAALNHPHIVTIYSNEDVDGFRFLAMELLEGQTLDASIVPGGLPIARFLEIAVPLADALVAAHQKQITHRDLKPGNVMVSIDGRVKVLDFGLASVGDRVAPDASVDETRAPLTHEGTIVGTMPYMSPEQVEGRPVDARSDLFSLGVMFHEMLTGVRPFRGDSSAALISSIMRDTPPLVTTQRPDVPDAIARLIARCLEQRLDDRMQTAHDVLDELRRVQKQIASGEMLRPAAAAVASIAVLPFADLSATKDQDWFCDGIAEEILNALAPLAGLRVAARASAFSFRGKTDDLRAIGEKLNVTTVLEGSVRRSGDRVRISAQLSDAQNGYQLWSERYDRELKDIFDVQDEIAHAIVSRLRVTLADGGQVRLVPKATGNLDAYELLLKGRVLQSRRGRAIVEAMACFERAIALDPNIAEAHALLGDTHRLMALYGLTSAAEAMPRARAAAERALALDPEQVEALGTLANIAAIYDWDLPAAAALSERASVLDPKHVRTQAERAIMLAISEELTPDLQQRILAAVGRARALDPLSAWVMAIDSMCLAFIGRPQEAVAAAERALALDDQNFTAHWALVFTLAWCGRHDEALAASVPALAMSGRHPRVLAEVAAVHALQGDVDGAESIYRELRSRARTGYVGAAERGAAAAAAGHMDEARALVAEAIAAREPYLTFWKLPAWKPFWQDPEGAALLRGTDFLRGRTATR